MEYKPITDEQVKEFAELTTLGIIRKSIRTKKDWGYARTCTFCQVYNENTVTGWRDVLCYKCPFRIVFGGDRPGAFITAFT